MSKIKIDIKQYIIEDFKSISDELKIVDEYYKKLFK
jgi:hypothetical protein